MAVDLLGAANVLTGGCALHFAVCIDHIASKHGNFWPALHFHTFEGAVILLVNKIFALETCKYTPHQFWVNDVCVFNVSCLWCKEVSFVRETVRTNGT